MLPLDAILQFAKVERSWQGDRLEHTVSGVGLVVESSLVAFVTLCYIHTNVSWPGLTAARKRTQEGLVQYKRRRPLSILGQWSTDLMFMLRKNRQPKLAHSLNACPC